ncbi:basic salivary proline-rich protein 1 isoform X2 [Aplysia californica]|uniref:Basic salivary proline-rich protein 1 isoform X2 n=1 Tax=Aplysia californica TaxID=6500 RepID=A0ABM0K922_APLCA|nr:basic salivary proline-rich protein 1 isoform X2 [Aplysia californica]
MSCHVVSCGGDYRPSSKSNNQGSDGPPSKAAKPNKLRSVGEDPPKSPFTPPPQANVRKPEQPAPPAVPEAPVVKKEEVPAPEQQPVAPPTYEIAKEAKSPFSPPEAEEWQEASAQVVPPIGQRRNRGQEEQRASPKRQRKPPVKSLGEAAKSRTRVGQRKRPPFSAYQDQQVRDMHEPGLGVTPWTRYPQKSRDGGNDGRRGQGGSARCGNRRYSPRSQICCQGNIHKRQEVNPACCGGDSYDTLFQKCCSGVVSFRSKDSSNC